MAKRSPSRRHRRHPGGGILPRRGACLLTGETPLVAARVARELSIDQVRAALLPEDKVAAIRELASGRRRRLAMLGDGVNDAPALASASVGIAMGGAGTDVALETADAALMGDDLGKLRFAVSLGRATRRVLRQNLSVALSSAIVLHEGSTLAVPFNSLRLLRHQEAGT